MRYDLTFGHECSDAIATATMPMSDVVLLFLYLDMKHERTIYIISSFISWNYVMIMISLQMHKTWQNAIRYNTEDSVHRLTTQIENKTILCRFIWFLNEHNFCERYVFVFLLWRTRMRFECRIKERNQLNSICYSMKTMLCRLQFQKWGHIGCSIVQSNRSIFEGSPQTFPEWIRIFFQLPFDFWWPGDGSTYFLKPKYFWNVE